MASDARRHVISLLDDDDYDAMRPVPSIASPRAALSLAAPRQRKSMPSRESLQSASLDDELIEIDRPEDFPSSRQESTRKRNKNGKYHRTMEGLKRNPRPKSLSNLHSSDSRRSPNKEHGTAAERPPAKTASPSVLDASRIQEADALPARSSLNGVKNVQRNVPSDKDQSPTTTTSNSPGVMLRGSKPQPQIIIEKLARYKTRKRSGSDTAQRTPDVPSRFPLGLTESGSSRGGSSLSASDPATAFATSGVKSHLINPGFVDMEDEKKKKKTQLMSSSTKNLARHSQRSTIKVSKIPTQDSISAGDTLANGSSLSNTSTPHTVSSAARFRPTSPIPSIETDFGQDDENIISAHDNVDTADTKPLEDFQITAHLHKSGDHWDMSNHAQDRTARSADHDVLIRDSLHNGRSLQAVSLLQSAKAAAQTQTPESSRAATLSKSLLHGASENVNSPHSRPMVGNMPPPLLPHHSVDKPAVIKKDVEECLKRHMNFCAEDHRYVAKAGHRENVVDHDIDYLQMLLARARAFAKVLQDSDFARRQPRGTFEEDVLERRDFNGMIGAYKKDPFGLIEPSKDSGRTILNAATMTSVNVEIGEPSGKKTKATTHKVYCQSTTWEDDSRSVPAYTHCTQVKKNVAAPNQKVLHSYPYFGEDVDESIYDTLKARYDLDAAPRIRKVQQGQQSRYHIPAVRTWLKQVGCSEDAVLYYLLNPRIPADQKDLYTTREKHCKLDFNRRGKRWSRVFVELSKLEFTPSQLQVASWACDAFLAQTGYSLWQIVRKSPITDLAHEAQVDVSVLDETQKLACRVCHEHDCPYHTDFQQPSSDSESYDEDDDEAAAEALDLDHPPENNIKRHVSICKSLSDRPDSRDEIVVAGRPRSRDKAGYKRLLEQVGATSNHEKNRFYPCYHPGSSCSDTRCKCFMDGLLCEKSCGCSRTCERKFQGCTCIFGSRKICYQDDRCDCFRLHRECDADLCRGCGADKVLDPEHRHDETIRLQFCQNVNMQLGVPKRTLLGRSMIHGFGVYAGERIKRHEFVGEYSGEIVLEDERLRRGEAYEIQKMSYLFILTEDQEIDSHHVGNKMRFVNHATGTGRNGACNLFPMIKLCNMTPRIGMFATRDIEVGEELFFNYGDRYTSLLGEAATDEKDEKDGKEKGKRKGGRAKKLVRRTKNRLIEDFAEPEYEDGRVPGSSASKTVTPRYSKGTRKVAGSRAKRDHSATSPRETAIKSAPSKNPIFDQGSGEEVSDSEIDGPEQVSVGRVWSRKKRGVIEDESEFEPDEDGVIATRSSGRTPKRRRLDFDDTDDDDVVEESEQEAITSRKYVAPIVNGKRKRGRPRKNPV